MKFKPSIIPALATLFFFSIAPAFAEDVRYYDFEIIIFESVDHENKISEVWKNDVVIDPPETFVTLGQPYPGPMPKEFNPKFTFKLLPQNAYRLSEEAKLIEADNNYRILLHTAWRQPGMSEETALPIHLHKEFSVTTPSQTTAIATTPDMPAVNLPAPRETTTITRSILDGYLKIILSRYLHAEFNLVYKTGLPYNPVTSTIKPEATDEETDTTQTAGPVIVSYHLQQSRKMRSKEIHYIDHPVIGVVILAWPVEINE
jgi:hypothetical protein